MLRDIFTTYGYKSVEPMEVYTDVFRLGTGLLQKKEEQPGRFKSNPIILGFEKDKTVKNILFEDQFESILKEYQKKDFAIISGLSYFGKKNMSAAANKCHALIFDLDEVSDNNLNTLLHGMNKGIYPKASYIVESGHGIHLYYVFAEPVALYPATKRLLKDLKYALTDLIWNMYTSENKIKQFQGINQGFRVIGGKTKQGATTVAYKVHNEPITIEYLNSFNKTIPLDTTKLYKESKMTIEEAKEKYPEWYERRVVQGKEKGTWTVKRDLYDWWIRKILEGASFGHRYYCIMCLAIYASKCNIPFEELKKDAYNLIDHMNSINPNEPFTESDVESALESYDERYKMFPRKDIEKITNIQMPANKRNYRKRADHVLLMNRMKDFKRELNELNEGRPSKREIIKNFRLLNPNAQKIECHKTTGISLPTIRKWWNSL